MDADAPPPQPIPGLGPYNTAQNHDPNADLDTTDSPASWAPQSPDLSHFPQDAPDPSFVHPQHRAYRGSVSSATSGPPFSPPQLNQAQLPHSSSPTLHSRPPPPQPPAVALVYQMPRQAKRDATMLDADYVPEGAPASASAVKAEDHNGENAPQPPKTIEIKNHFPTARIKRIMQADDDVGKVAQVTPVVVGKSTIPTPKSFTNTKPSQPKPSNSS